MRLERTAKLFIGLKAEGKLRAAFLSAEQRGGYFDQDGTGPFLTNLEVDGHTYLGKIVDGGLSTASVDDVTRNVLSILRRLMRGERLPSNLAIFAIGD